MIASSQPPEGGPGRVDPATEVWNRATSGVPFSELPGDVALAHALRFDGYAAAGSVLAAVEMELGEGWGGDGRAAFAYFGVTEAQSLIDDAVAELHELEHGPEEGPANEVAYDAADTELSARYDGVTDALFDALVTALAQRPADFAATTGHETEPRMHSQEELEELSDQVALQPDAQATYAVDVTADEKARRSAAALVAFGIEASETDGQVRLVAQNDAEWQLIDDVLALIDRRFPEPN